MLIMSGTIHLRNVLPRRRIHCIYYVFQEWIEPSLFYQIRSLRFSLFGWNKKIEHSIFFYSTTTSIDSCVLTIDEKNLKVELIDFIKNKRENEFL